MSVLAVLAATVASLGALGCLAASDPKRRRAFRRSPPTRRAPRLGWAAVLAPGVLAVVAGGAGGFVIWFGAVSVAGWALVAISPDRFAALEMRLSEGRRRLARATGSAKARIMPLARSAAGAAGWRPGGGRMAALEARIAVLEAEVARLRAAGHPEPLEDGVVIELARPAGRR